MNLSKTPTPTIRSWDEDKIHKSTKEGLYRLRDLNHMLEISQSEAYRFGHIIC